MPFILDGAPVLVFILLETEELKGKLRVTIFACTLTPWTETSNLFIRMLTREI